MDASKAGALAVVGAALFLVPVLVIVMFLGSSSAAPDDGICRLPGRPGTVPSGSSVAGFSGNQLENAAKIMAAASDLGLPVSAQILGVQAAIGESALRVMDRGDAAGPDSRGLFQQRANGAWGSYEDRMNPRTSALNFFKALQRVEGWDELSPTLAIHRVQRNADPNHYARFRAPAAAIVVALSESGGAVDAAPIGTDGTCPETDGEAIGELGSGKWVHPLPGGRQTSGFGSRACPAGTECNAHTSEHKGVDFARGGQSQVLAPADMRITVAEQGQGWKAAYGTYVIAEQLDQPGLVFEFHHLAHGSLMVEAGDSVAAGTPIGVEGSTGNSSGVHLHFQVASPNAPSGKPTYEYAVDPVPFLREKGVL